MRKTEERFPDTLGESHHTVCGWGTCQTRVGSPACVTIPFFCFFFLCTLSEIFAFCASEHSGILLLLGCITYVLRQVRLLLSYFSLTSLLLLS
jgi:hypothetical protein